MGWLKKTFKKVIRVVAPIQVVIADVIRGEKPEDAVKEVVKAPIELVKEATEAVGSIEVEIKKVISKLVEKVAGDDARKILEDLYRLSKPLDTNTAKSLLGSLNNFIDTGDLEYLNPLISIVAGEINEAREQYWDNANTLPINVIESIPEQLKPFAQKARFINVNEASGLSLPAISTNHLKKVRAIVTIDLIFFDDVPGDSSIEDLYLWTHELFHVKQYAELGLEGFVKRFIGNELGFQSVGSEGNGIEIDADLFACKAFPVDNPSYLRKPCSEYT